MNYLYASDERYLPHAAASLVSLCEHTPPDAEAQLHLLSMGIQPESARALRELAGRYGRTLHIWEMGDLEAWFGHAVDTGGFALSAMARLFLARVLPADVHRVLYLDCDTIVLEDLTPLEHLDMQGCPVGMVQEPTVRHDRLTRLGLTPETVYHNSGVLLIDLDRWRAENTEQAVLDYFRAHAGDIIAPDQDALNGALAGRIRLLPPRYNYGSVQIYYRWAAQRKMCAPAPFYPTEAAYAAAAEPPAIVHFLGEERPWRAGNTHPYRQAYLDALAQTPWRDTPPEEGWRGYFACFRLFNTLTRPFPLLRWRIINALIPAFMRWRAQARSKQHGN